MGELTTHSNIHFISQASVEITTGVGGHKQRIMRLQMGSTRPSVRASTHQCPRVIVSRALGRHPSSFATSLTHSGTVLSEFVFVLPRFTQPLVQLQT